MISEGIKELRVYWVEDIIKGDECWWIDVGEDRLDEICEFSWVWDIISKAEAENGDDYQESDCGSLESYIIVDELFSEQVVKNVIEGWLKDRELDIKVEIISPDGTVAEKRILDSIDEARKEFPELVW